MKKSLIFLFVFFLLELLVAKSPTRFVARIPNPTKEDVIFFYNQNYDIASYNPNNYLDLVVDNKLFSKIKALGYDAFITQTEEQLKNNLSDKSLSGYRSYDDMLSELQQIEADHPDICKLYDIGDSWGKIYSAQGYSEYDDFQHDIWVLKISDNVETEEDEPNIFYTGEHHAREPISMEMVMKIINHIVNNYGIDQQITNDVNKKQIWFLPLINPNGHKLVWDETDVWWRKNIRDNNNNHHIYQGNSTDSQDGVDPNRNYGFQWGNVGASDSWDSDVYHGPEAFSEPNTQAVRDFISSHKFVAGISYHSYSELVLFPFGYDNNVVAPDHDALEDLAIDMANTIPKLNGGHYTPQESWQLYPCMGTSDDYFYGEHGIFAYTIELGVEFIPPSSTMNMITDDNLQAAMILLDRVDSKVLTGHIYDSVTNQPLEAKVYVEGVDNTGVEVNQHKSDRIFGRYYRLLLPDTYTVTFSKYGYQSQTFTVDITSDAQTVLDVSLEPITTFINFEGFVYSCSDYQPIENATVSFTDIPIDTVYTSQNGEFFFENIVPGTYNLQISKVGYRPYYSTLNINEDTAIPVFLEVSSAEDFENGIPDEWQSHILINSWHIDNSQAYSGEHSLCSNDISSNQSAIFKFRTSDLSNQSIVSFYHKVSSEANYDFLNFYIDNQLQYNWSGESDWAYSEFTVPPGIHDLEWNYQKDAYVDSGQDCAWIDLVNIPTGETSYPFIYMPNVFTFEINQNTAIDTFFTVYNNTSQNVNIEINTSANWIDITDNSNFTLSAYTGKFIHFGIQNLNEGQYSSEIQINSNGNLYSIPVTVFVSNVNSNNEQLGFVTQLHSPYPNPFFVTNTKRSIKIKYQIAKKSKTELAVYNLKGQMVRKFIDKVQNSGEYSVSWDLKDKKGYRIPSGIYFYKLKTQDKTIIKKISIIK